MVKGKLGIIPNFFLRHNVFVTRLISLIWFYGNHEDVTTFHNCVDASHGGSISIEITLLTNPYKIFLNDSNEHGYYYFKI
jgi:hypothetical protein